MRKKKDDSFSQKVFNENLNKFRNDNTTDYFNDTKQAIKLHYDEDNYNREQLVERLTQIKFLEKYHSEAPSSLLTSLIIGFVVFVISQGLLFIDSIFELIESNNIILQFSLPAISLLAFLFLVIVMCKFVMSTHRRSLENIHNNYYPLYILPYERRIVNEKLRSKYNLDLD